MASLGFSDYYRKRQRVDEIADWFKKKTDQAKQAVGYQDEKGNTSVDKVAAIKAAQAGGEAGGGVMGAVGAAGQIGAGVATMNPIAIGQGVWGLITSIVNAGKGLQGMGQAGSLVELCLRHRKGLHEYLSKQLEPAAVDEVVKAVFEIKNETAWEIPNPLWAPIAADFGKQLEDGYHGIENKIFAVVVVRHLQDWVKSKYGMQADDTRDRVDDAMKRLKQEVQQSRAILQKPGDDGVPPKDKVEEFNPDSNGQHQDQQVQQDAEKNAAKDASQKNASGKPTTEAEFNQLPPITQKLNKGDVVYKLDYREGQGRYVKQGVVTNDNQYGLFTFYEGDNHVWGDNPDLCKTLGEHITDPEMRNTELYRDLIKFIKNSGHGYGGDWRKSDIGYWGQELGLV